MVKNLALRLFSLLLVLSSTSAAAADLWVVLKGSKEVAVLDSVTLKEQQRVKVATFPHEILVRGNVAVVSLYGRWGKPGNALALIDIKTRKNVGSIPLGEGTMPHGLVPTADPNLVVVTAEGKNKVFLVDIAKRAIAGTITTTEGGVHLGTFDSKRHRVYLSNISTGTITAVSLQPFKLIRHVKTGDEPEGIAYHAKSDTIWVTHRKDDSLKVLAAEDFTVKHSLKTGKFPIRISFDPTGDLAFVSLFQDSKLQVFGTAPVRKVRDVSLFAGSSWTSRAWKSWQSEPRAIGQVFSPNDHSFYVALSGLDRIVQFDGKSFKHVKTISLPKTPDSMAIISGP